MVLIWNPPENKGENIKYSVFRIELNNKYLEVTHNFNTNFPASSQYCRVGVFFFLKVNIYFWSLTCLIKTGSFIYYIEWKNSSILWEVEIKTILHKLFGTIWHFFHWYDAIKFQMCSRWGQTHQCIVFKVKFTISVAKACQRKCAVGFSPH